jgi:hypothetical protein
MIATYDNNFSLPQIETFDPLPEAKCRLLRWFLFKRKPIYLRCGVIEKCFTLLYHPLRLPYSCRKLHSQVAMPSTTSGSLCSSTATGTTDPEFQESIMLRTIFPLGCLIPMKTLHSIERVAIRLRLHYTWHQWLGDAGHIHNSPKKRTLCTCRCTGKVNFRVLRTRRLCLNQVIFKPFCPIVICLQH